MAESQIDPQTLIAFFERFVPAKMAETHAPGCAVHLVGRDGVLFSKGWGTASLERGDAFDPEQTWLRFGSISKVVTATAVMQCFERGELELDAPIGAVLPEDFRSAAGVEPSTTLRALLTHRAGLGDRFAGQGETDSAAIADIDGYLRREMTPPVPGERDLVLYSNQGITLAALLVERAVGRPFHRICVDRIFAPLGADSLTFLPTAEDAVRMAEGYNWVFGHNRRLPLRHWKPYPASSLTGTISDLGRFLRAHVGDGSLPGEPARRILLPGSVAAMHERQFRMHPDAPGIALTFWEREEAGMRVTWHSGHMPGHRTGFFVLRDAGVGFIINANTDIPFFREALTGLCAELAGSGGVERNPGTPITIRPVSPETDEEWSGTYRHVWYPRNTFGKSAAFMGMQGQELIVSRDADGGFCVDDPDLAGRSAAGGREGAGRATLWFGGFDRFHRIAWWERRAFQVPFFVAVAAITFLGSMASWISLFLGGAGGTSLPAALWGVSGLVLTGFVAGIYGVTAKGAYGMMQDLPASLRAVLVLPPVGLLAGLAATAVTVNEWALLHPALICLFALQGLATIGWAAFLQTWRLLGWRF